MSSRTTCRSPSCGTPTATRRAPYRRPRRASWWYSTPREKSPTRAWGRTRTSRRRCDGSRGRNAVRCALPHAVLRGGRIAAPNPAPRTAYALVALRRIRRYQLADRLAQLRIGRVIDLAAPLRDGGDLSIRSHDQQIPAVDPLA